VAEHTIHHTKRTLWAHGAMLVGYDIQGKMLLGLPTDPKSVSTWMRGGCKADLARVRKAWDELEKAE
jgi:hypothetical protein